MPRPSRPPDPTKPRRSVVAALLLVASVAAACGAGQAGPELPDAASIVTATLKAAETAKSVHVEVAIDGNAAITLPVGGTSGPIDLTGTTISADVDLAGSAMHATFAAPGILNVSGELVVTGGDAYLRSSITGPKYRSVDLRGVLPIDPSRPGALVDQLGDFLLAPGVDPVKGADTTCGSGRCYTVTVDLDAAKLATITGGGASGLPVDLSGATFKLTMLVDKALPYHLTELTAELTLTGGNAITIDARFSKWDEPVTITAPPVDQVASPS